MAKDTTNTGFLNFGMDGDNKELLKNLEQAKNEAKSIENIYKNINLNAGGKTIAANTQKSQIAADKLIISQNKVTQSAMNALKAEQQLETAIINETNAKARGVVIERQRMLALQKSLLYAKQGEALSAESARKEALYKQKLLVEEERLAGIRKRNAMIYLQEEKELASASAQTNKTMFNPQNLLQQLSSATGFIKELMTVSGEFEKQRISLTAIIGDDQAGNRIFSQIKELAVTSPFDFKELTDSAKQLSAFSVPANEIFETTNRLADLSAGLGVDMSRIVNAYGQVQSASVLRIQELQQFTEAGIPLVDELAKKFTNLSGEVVSAGDVIDKISNGEVSFGMIKEIITELTSEGGKFYNMQELQSETLAGKISSLRNNYDMLLDSLGKANKGLLNGAVDGLIELMENWEKYWNILKGIIITYGTYKTAIFVIAKGTTIAANAQKLYNTYLLMTYISGEKFGSIIDMISVKFESLDKVTKRTLVAGVIAAIFGIGYAIKTAYDESHKLEKSLSENFGKIKGSADASVLSLDNMLIRLKNATVYSTEWNNIIKQINKSYGEYLPFLLKESDTYDEIEKKLKGVSTAIYERAKAQSYVNSIKIIEENLSKNLSKAYDMAFKSLTEKPLFGFDQVILSKNEANEVIDKAFTAIRESPQLYKERYEVQKLISGILSDAFKGRNVDTSITGLLNYSQLGGLFDGVYLHAKAWNESAESANYAIEKNDILFSQINNYKKQIDQIAQKYAALAKNIDKIPITNGFNIDEAKTDNTIKMLNEMLEVYKQYGQFDLARDTERQIETIKKNGEGWRKELQDILGQAITINTESNIADVVDEIKKKYKELTTTTKEQSDILKNANFNFGTNSFNYPANNAIRQIAESYKANKSDLDSLGKALQFIGITVASVLGGASGGSGKDEFAEKLKKRIDLLKEVRSEYDKLVKAGKNSDEAAIYLMELDSFKGIDARNYEQEIQKIIDDLKKKGKLSEQQRSILESLILGKDKDQITKDIEQTAKETKAAFEKIEKYLSEYKEKYNLYRQVSNITGDDKYAARVVFGEADASVKPDIEMQKEAFKEQSGISFSDFINLDDENKAKLLINDELKKLYNSIEQTEKEEQNRKKDIYLSSLKDYQDIQEKRLALTKEYQEKIAIARSYNDEKLAGKLETALSGDLLKLTPDYEKFFSAIYSMTKDKANDIGTLIKENLKDQLDQGVISAKEYYESIEKVNNELEKSETGVNLFDRFQSGGVEGLLNGIKEKASSRLKAATIDLEKAKSDWSKSFDEWKEAMKSGDKSAADIAQNNMMSATNRQSIAQDSVNKSESMLNWVSKIQAAFAKTGKIVDYIDQSVRGAQRIVDTFADLAEQRGIDTSKGAWGEIKNVMSVISQVNEKVKGIFESGKSGDIGGMVAGTVELIAIGFKSVNGEHKKALKLLEAQRKQLEHTYAISKARKSLEYEQGNTVFGNDPWGKATNAAKVYSEQQKVMEESLQKLNDASVVTGSKKSGWGAFRKRKDVWQNLLKAYPELIDSAGKFNKELAESILNNRKLDEEGKTNLQHAIENAQLLEDAYAKMKDYLSNIFGKLGEDMTDAFVDSFKNGTDAVEAFYKSASGMLERLAKDMIYSVTLAPIIEEAQKKMEGVMKNTSLNDEERFYKYTDIIGGLINNALDKQNDVNALIERVKDRAKKENNIEIFGPDKSNQDTLSKGIESVTEETANLVASYLNAMRAEQAAQGLNLIELVRLNQLNTDQFANMYAELIRIQVNTLTTANNTSRLVELGENTNTILRQATISGSGTKFNI